jgi:hypothetical protein
MFARLVVQRALSHLTIDNNTLRSRCGRRPKGIGSFAEDLAREGLMPNKFQGTWYVSFERPPGKRRHPRGTETFPNEREAKKFAREKLAKTKNVSAGTLNPHLPKQTIASAKMLEWLKEPDEADLA